MLKPHRTAWGGLLAAMLMAGTACGQPGAAGSGQEYPFKPLRIVTSEPGGGSDFVTRLIAQSLASPLGQQVIVDNRPSGVIPGDTVAKAAPDGYTLLLSGSALWVGPLLQKTPYDPLRDFAPVVLVGSTPNILAVHPSLPVKSVKELIALAKARPGELNYSSAGTGTSTHLSAELFKSMAGINLVRIPYKGSAPAINALISGEAQVSFANAAAGLSHVKSRRMRALAVTGAQPSALLPGLPTVAASGVPGYEAAALQGMFAPARTPPPVITRLNQEVTRILGRPDIRDKFLGAGVETVGGAPEQFAATIKSEITAMGKVIRDAGIGVQ